MDIIEVWQSRTRVFKVIFSECGHTFVMNMTFSHTLSPSGRTYSRIVKDIADNIAPAQREEIAAFLTNSAKEAREEERRNSEAKSTVVRRS